MTNEQFLRTEMLLGPAAMEKLARSHVAVFGLGGVGSWCVEALARSGVGTLTLIDNDQVGVSNINRQLQALHSTVGLDKTEALARRVLDINPGCQVHQMPRKYEADCREDFFRTRYDYIVDAIDLVSCKLDLIETALQREIPIISCMGTGNKLDPSQFRVADISKTEGCALARIIRKELKNRGIRHHKVVFSPELPAQTIPTGEAPPPGRRSIPASAPWVPPVAGFLLAGAVIQDLIQE
ncbi:MAG: tRNA threonylcarbamoyladenosine dehydratase [Ruminiclostridium sp.]|nr:tRNA threonylcarbamoyladenosine dehydratase [Ruminiclostridium sp.]